MLGRGQANPGACRPMKDFIIVNGKVLRGFRQVNDMIG